MLAKSLLLAGVLAVASVPMAFGKTYEVAFTTSVWAGGTQLAPGTYSVQAKHGEALFTNLLSGDTYEIPAKLQKLPATNQTMKIETGRRNGETQIESIQLGGQPATLQFTD